MVHNDVAEFKRRVTLFQQHLKEKDVFAALIQKQKNLYYFAGTGQPSNLWIPAEGEPILFTRRAHEMAEEASWLTNIQKANNYNQIVKILQDKNIYPPTNSYIGVESDIIPYNMIKKFEDTFSEAKITNITSAVMATRLVKSDFEIGKIRNAATLWSKAHEAILQSNAAGKTEYEFSALLEYEARKNGGDGLVSFHRWDGSLPGGAIVASGENAWVVSGHAMTVTGVGLSPALPWGASNRIIQKGDLVVTDYGISKEAYHCDMARTYAVGKATIEQKDLWDKLIELHFTVIDKVRPGVTGAELYEHALQKAKSFGLEENFMGVGEARGAYIGHSLGLEIDEWPVIGPKATEPLEANTIITLEPKFMVPNLGAVMVEDDILVTPSGHEIIGKVDHNLNEI